MWWFVVLGIVGFAGCGRIAFEPRGDASSDATDASAVAAPMIARIWQFGATAEDVGNALTATEQAVSLAGRMSGLVDFGGGNQTSNGGFDAFVVRIGVSTKVHEASFTFGSIAHDEIEDIRTDAAGNYYVTGHHQGAITLSNGTIGHSGSVDCFVASFTPAGVRRWSYAIGGAAVDRCEDAVLDGAGNLYIVGTHRGVATLADGTLATPGGSQDFFVSSFTSGGAHRFTRRIGGPGNEGASWIALDPAESMVVVTGAYSGQPVTIGSDTLTGGGYNESFIAAFSTIDGAPLWARNVAANVAASTGVSTTGVAVDDARIYTVGYIQDYTTVGQVDFGDGPRVVDEFSGFLTVHNKDGSFRAARVFTSTGFDAAWEVTAHGGNVYASFETSGPVETELGTVGTGPYSSPLMSFDSDGALRWTIDFGSNVATWGVAPVGSTLWVAGSLRGTQTYAVGTFTSAGANDALLFELTGL